MKVTVLQIDHKHGTDIYVCKSMDIAMRELAEYCRQWWGDLREFPPYEGKPEKE